MRCVLVYRRAISVEEDEEEDDEMMMMTYCVYTQTDSTRRYTGVV